MSQGSAENISATVRRFTLAARLRQYREARGLTHEQVADQLQAGPGKWSKSKISRIENREHNLKPGELERMLDLYGITDQEIRLHLHEMAAKAHERGWWVAYRGSIPEQLYPRLDFESAMIELREYALMLVPGPLQTADYARALISGISPHLAPDQVELRVTGRMTRQQILRRQHPPHLHVVLHPVLLKQPIGPPSVMRAQLERLVELAESPNITIQVLPERLGVNPGLEGSFAVFSLPEPVPDYGYTEGPGGGVYIDDPAHVRRLMMRFGTLAQTALPAGDAVNLIAKAAEGFN
jgi:transcriptional regulator with XRE-family HTH domain